MTSKIDMHEQLLQIVDEEIARAIAKHGALNSRHEAYAVLLEELEEAEHEFNYVKEGLCSYWSRVKHDLEPEGILKIIEKRALNAVMELIQVAAVCQKFIRQEEAVE